MKKIIILLLFYHINIYSILAQFNWLYYGKVKGDEVTLAGNYQGGKISGTMEDSQQKYELTASILNDNFNGRAVNDALGITFLLKGQFDGNNLYLDGYLEYLGSEQKVFSATFEKSPLVIPPAPATEIYALSGTQSIPNEVSSKSIDPLIIGLWREESHYNSGYGDQAFSGSTYSYMRFNSDHTISENGSQASMSGSNYSGTAGGQSAGQVIPNLWYYTSNGKVITYIVDKGQKLTIELGSYYIEGDKMLFTQVNTDKKILYTKM